jgi:hypothetical protein
MDFVHYDLNQLRAGQIVEVTLDTAANVRLLDDQNFHGYRSGRQYSFYGGYVTESPYRVRVPHGGHWHLAIDLGGYPGQVRSGVRVLGGGV